MGFPARSGDPAALMPRAIDFRACTLLDETRHYGVSHGKTRVAGMLHVQVSLGKKQAADTSRMAVFVDDKPLMASDKPVSADDIINREKLAQEAQYTLGPYR